jgi:hypothetical protein
MHREIQQVVNVSDKSAIDEMEEKLCNRVTQKAVQSGYSTSIISVIELVPVATVARHTG